MNHVQIISSLVFLCLMDNGLTLMYAAAQNEPPILLPSVQTFIRGQTGLNISLSCPFTGDPQPMYEWYKDGERITSFWERYQLQENVLTIYVINCEDQGSYICKAVNGFGSQKMELQLEITDACNSEEFEDDQDDKRLNSGSEGSIPVIMRKKPMNNKGHILKPEGSSVEMKCIAGGYPVPDFIWLKGGVEMYKNSEKIDIHDSYFPQVGMSNTNIKIRSILKISQLNGNDSANYTCRAQNRYGSTEDFFNLEVVERAIPQQPKLDPLFPSNNSAEIGQPASLTCKVKSELPTNIHWFKRLKNVPTSEMDAAESPMLTRNKTILMNSTYYQFLPSTPTVNTEGDNYLSKLLFPKANDENDTGTYVCLALNNVGYSYREVHFNVINPLTKAEVNLDPATAIIVCLVVLLCFGALGGACFVLRKRKQNVKSGLLNITSSPRSLPNSQLTGHRLTNPESSETAAPLIQNSFVSYPVFREGFIRNEPSNWESSPRMVNSNFRESVRHPEYDGTAYRVNHLQSSTPVQVPKRVYYGRHIPKYRYRNEYHDNNLLNSYPNTRLRYPSEALDKYYRPELHNTPNSSFYYVPNHSSGRIPRPSPETSFDSSFQV